MSLPIEKIQKAVVIGASAGAVETLNALIPKLPADYPFPIIIVVHLPPYKKSVLAELFQSKCTLEVKEVEDKEMLKPRTIYFAPPDYHVLIEKNYSLSLSSDDPVHFSRPSIDVLFESASDALGPNTIGVILTGANQDGAMGLKSIKDAGGIALIQNPQEAWASEMPNAAIEVCQPVESLSLLQILSYLENLGVTQ